MTIDFAALLTDQQKRSLLEQRVQQFAAEGYQHELNKQVAESTGDEAAATAADQAIVTISAAIEQHMTALAALPAAE